MNTVLRTYLAIAMALTLALTGQSVARAVGSAGGLGQMVLCTGTGPVMVFVDENGVPTKPPEYCPDRALNLLVAVAPADLAPRARVSRPVALPTRAAHVQGVEIRTLAHARAPPFVV